MVQPAAEYIARSVPKVGRWERNAEFWIRIIPPVLGGFAGILALVMLATPKVSDWSAAKRRR